MGRPLPARRQAAFERRTKVDRRRRLQPRWADGSGRCHFFSGEVTIFLGRGDGSFEDPYPIHLAQGLSSLAVIALDSDGSLDLVAANFLSGVLTVLKGAPDGSFAVEATLGSVPAVSLVYVQDFNGDGHQDLIAVDASEKRAWLFIGNGHGAFLPGKSIDPQAVALRLATQPRTAATTPALSQLPAICKDGRGRPTRLPRLCVARKLGGGLH